MIGAKKKQSGFTSYSSTTIRTLSTAVSCHGALFRNQKYRGFGMDPDISKLTATPRFETYGLRTIMQNANEYVILRKKKN